MKFADKDKFASYLKKWQTLLRIIIASLENVEEKQTSSRSLELWLSDLRDVAYDAEDIIDELTTEAWRRQITEDPDAASPTCKVGRYFSASFLRLNPSTAKFSTKMEFRLKSLTARLEETVAMKDALSLVENDRGIRDRPRTNSLVDESCVYCRECDKDIVGIILIIQAIDSDSGESYAANAFAIWIWRREKSSRFSVP
ncbi:hypothetical protein Gogos_010521 [Gossypium gossypioides]|uniref:Disease resistance N-terminal domain-containing protein n=1 Tax=Gossypium gossypioides TaxID=34282 RepID=A0A7J9BLG4_GOSGO|nr:hypothetical protein [Gossypium gossypioides]